MRSRSQVASLHVLAMPDDPPLFTRGRFRFPEPEERAEQTSWLVLDDPGRAILGFRINTSSVACCE